MWAFGPGLFLLVIGLTFGLIYWLIFSSLSVALTIFVIVWVSRDIYYALKKKSVIDIFKTIFRKRDTKKRTFTLLFSAKSSPKQWVGIVCIVVSFYYTIVAISVPLKVWFSPLQLTDLLPKYSFYFILLIFAVLPYLIILAYQICFLYTLTKRFSKFLEVWAESPKGIKSKEIDAPPLPTGGLLMFTVNSILNIFPLKLVGGASALAHAAFYRMNLVTASGGKLPTLVAALFLIILPLINISLLAIYLKNGKDKISTKNLHRDNIRIPIVLSISIVTATFHSSLIIRSLFIVFSILAFYSEDWNRIVEAKYSKNPKKKELIRYLGYSILSLPLFASGPFLGSVAYISGLLVLLVCILFIKLEQEAEKSK